MAVDLYAARKALANFLATQGYDTSEIDAEGPEDVRAAEARGIENLQFSLRNAKTGATWHVIWVAESLAKDKIQPIFEEFADVLGPRDTLAIMVFNKPVRTVCAALRAIWSENARIVKVIGVPLLCTRFWESHLMVPHAVVAADEAPFPVDKMPEIHRDDAGILLLDARPGDAIKVDRWCPVRGRDVVYHRVVNTFFTELAEAK